MYICLSWNHRTNHSDHFPATLLMLNKTIPKIYPYEIPMTSSAFPESVCNDILLSYWLDSHTLSALLQFLIYLSLTLLLIIHLKERRGLSKGHLVNYKTLSLYIFKLALILHKAEQSLQGMELQKKKSAI